MDVPRISPDALAAQAQYAEWRRRLRESNHSGLFRRAPHAEDEEEKDEADDENASGESPQEETPQDGAEGDGQEHLRSFA